MCSAWSSGQPMPGPSSALDGPGIGCPDDQALHIVSYRQKLVDSHPARVTHVQALAAPNSPVDSSTRLGDLPPGDADLTQLLIVGVVRLLTVRTQPPHQTLRMGRGPCAASGAAAVSSL